MTVTPIAESIAAFRDGGGAGKPVQAGMKVSWDIDADAALDAARRLWANDGLPGQLAQILPRPQDFEAAMSLVPPETVAETIVCGDDPKAQIDRVREYLDAGVDEVYVHQIGPDMDGFFRAWSEQILPELR